MHDRGWVPAVGRARPIAGDLWAWLRGGMATVSGMALLISAVLWTLARQAPPVMFQRCVTPDRHLAWIGVHLALLRERPGCATGQLAFDAGPGHIAGLVVIIAAPTLLANLFMLFSAVGVGVAIRALLARAAEAVRPLWHKLVGQAPILPMAPVAAPPRGVGRRLRAWQLDRSPVLRRGPPVQLAF